MVALPTQNGTNGVHGIVVGVGHIDNAQLWIDRAFINGEYISSSETFAVHDPANGDILGHCPEQTVEDTRRAILAASIAFTSWSQTTPYQRQAVLLKIVALMEQNLEDLATIITLENGKPLAEARAEIKTSVSYFNWFAAQAIAEHGDHVPSANPSLRNVVSRRPIGVVALITPWNFPSAMIARKVAPALAAGCTIVLKAPAETPFSALALSRLLQEAGLPNGVFNIVTGNTNTASIGRELCENTTVKKLSFTGSTAVGKILMSQSSSSLKKLSLELGGLAPFVVFEDADIDAAVDGAIACKMRGNGQTCVCANGIFVHKDIYDAFSQKFIGKVKQLKTGHGLQPKITNGPLIHGRACERIESLVQDAVEKGATVGCGGSRLKGNFFEPTVLLNMTDDARVCREEIFGPIACLFSFTQESDLLARLNESTVGLAAYFYTRDLSRGWRFAEKLEVGMVGINTPLISQPCSPFAGVKESGFGVEGSKYGMAEYQVIKAMTFSI